MWDVHWELHAHFPLFLWIRHCLIIEWILENEATNVRHRLYGAVADGDYVISGVTKVALICRLSWVINLHIPHRSRGRLYTCHAWVTVKCYQDFSLEFFKCKLSLFYPSLWEYTRGLQVYQYLRVYLTRIRGTYPKKYYKWYRTREVLWLWSGERIKIGSAIYSEV